MWRGFLFPFMAFPAALHEFKSMLKLKLSRGHESRILAADKSGKVWEVMAIKVGLSKNRSEDGAQFFYGKEMLQKLLPQFDGMPAYVFQDEEGRKKHIADRADDAKRLTGVIGNKVGVYKNPRWGKDADGNEGIICDLHLANEQLASEFKDMWERGFKDYAELSIDGDGEYTEDTINGVPVANATIHNVHSCDIVDSAAAGGKFLRIAAATNHKGQKTMKANARRLLIRVLECRAAAKKSSKTEARITRFLEAEGEEVATVAAEVLQEQSKEMQGDGATQWIALAKEALTALESGDSDAATASLKKLLELEAQQAAKEAETQAAAEAADKTKETDKPNTDTKPNTEAGVKPEEMNALKETVDELKTTLADERNIAEIDKANLPDPVKEKLKESVKGRGLDLKRIKESISIEQATLEKLGFGDRGGSIRSISDVGMAEIELALDGFWEGEDMLNAKKQRVPRFRNLKEAAIKGFRVDRESIENPDALLGLLCANQYNSRHRIKEAFSTATFDRVFGDSMNRKFLREVNLPDFRQWEKITEQVEVKDFRDNEYIRVGYWGEAPVVDPDGGNYNDIGALGGADEGVLVNVETRGFTFSITRKMIINDDMRLIRLLPVRAARVLKKRPYRAVFDLLIANTVCSYDSVALLNAGHSNLTSGALTPTTLDDVRLKMYSQTAYGSDPTNPEYLEELNWPKFLIIHPTKEQMALALCKAQSTVQVAAASGEWAAGQLLPNGGAPNVHAQFGMDYIMSPRISNSAHWWAIADPKNVPGIVVAFLNGQTEPELTQELVGSGSNFTAKKVTYCVSHEVGVKVVDHRAIAGYTS